MRSSRWKAQACGALVAAAIAGASSAATLVGADFVDGHLYDVDAATGLASNPRAITAGATLVNFVADVEFGPAGTLHAIASESASPVPNFPSALFRVDIETGAATLVAALAEKLAEGDLAFDAASGDLLAFARPDGFAPYRLIRIDPATGDTALVGTLADLGIDPSGLSMTAAGDLYALDTQGDDDALLRLDPGDASVLATTPLSAPLGNVAGLDFDDATGTLYVADGGSAGTQSLYTLDPATGGLTLVGATGLASGLSGLAVPEPGSAALGAVAAVVLAARCRRRLRVD